jgi:hypothetical protein
MDGSPSPAAPQGYEQNGGQRHLAGDQPAFPARILPHAVNTLHFGRRAVFGPDCHMRATMGVGGGRHRTHHGA